MRKSDSRHIAINNIDENSIVVKHHHSSSMDVKSIVKELMRKPDEKYY